MNPCKPCLHFHHCMERRGICTEYKDLEMIRNEIKMLNNTETATRTKDGDKAGPQ